MMTKRAVSNITKAKTALAKSLSIERSSGKASLEGALRALAQRPGMINELQAAAARGSSLNDSKFARARSYASNASLTAVAAAMVLGAGFSFSSPAAAQTQTLSGDRTTTVTAGIFIAATDSCSVRMPRG